MIYIIYKAESIHCMQRELQALPEHRWSSLCVALLPRLHGEHGTMRIFIIIKVVIKVVEIMAQPRSGWAQGALGADTTQLLWARY